MGTSTEKQTPDFLSVLSGKITEMESTMASNSSHSKEEKESAKHRKRVLKEMEKFCSDKTHSVEDKVDFLQTKYTQMVTDLHRVEKSFFETQSKLNSAALEKDKAQLELKKSNTVRDKLEELCRQLQKDNRSTLETAHKLREEDIAARAATHAEFKSKIEKFTANMEEEQGNRMKQLEENISLREKLEGVANDMNAFDKLLHSKDLEVQLANAKLAQQEAINEQLTKKNELYMQSHEQMEKTHSSVAAELEVLVVTKQHNALLQQSNDALKQQLTEYGKQFQSIQAAITKSNKTFEQYKKDMERSNMQRTQLLLDYESLKAKHNSSESQVVQLQGQLALAAVDPEEVKRLHTQKAALEGLCRSLQAQVKLQGKSEEGGELHPPRSCQD